MDTAGKTALDALTAKVEELGRMCAQLSEQNAELRAQVLSLHGGTTQSGARRADRGARGSGPEGTVTRRVLGKRLGAAAAGAVGVTALVDLGARPAAASTGSNITAGNITTAERRTAVLYDGTSGYGGVVLLGNDSTYDGGSAGFPAALGGWAGAGGTAGSGGVPNGIYGYTDNGNGYGVVGINSSAVGAGGSGVLGMVNDGDVDGVTGINNGSNSDAIGVHGVITSTSPGTDSAGVRGQNRGTSAQGFGIWGSHDGSGVGLFGQSLQGIGVSAVGGSVGVQASGSIAVDASGATAVFAIGQGATGIAVSAQADSSRPAVIATNSGDGAGVTGTSGSGPGVRGSSVSGRGGVFSGGPAQVQLLPGTGASHPKGGKRGDLYADKTGRLWFCKKSGTTATWHQIA